jgi:hypothetical protein
MESREMDENVTLMMLRALLIAANESLGVARIVLLRLPEGIFETLNKYDVAQLARDSAGWAVLGKQIEELMRQGIAEKRPDLLDIFDQEWKNLNQEEE